MPEAHRDDVERKPGPAGRRRVGGDRGAVARDRRDCHLQVADQDDFVDELSVALGRSGIGPRIAAHPGRGRARDVAGSARARNVRMGHRDDLADLVAQAQERRLPGGVARVAPLHRRDAAALLARARGRDAQRLTQRRDAHRVHLARERGSGAAVVGRMALVAVIRRVGLVLIRDVGVGNNQMLEGRHNRRQPAGFGTACCRACKHPPRSR